MRAHPQEGDAWEARDRLDAHRRFDLELSAQFATATRATDPEIIPPGYRPLLASTEADRPLYAAASKGDLTSAAPFSVPADVTETAIGTGALMSSERRSQSELPTCWS